MSKKIYHSDFCFRYTYQYFTKSRGNYIPSGKPIGAYSGIVQRIYLEGDEDTVWEDIKLKLGESNTKRFTFVSKEIKNIKYTGKQIKNIKSK